jgi:hypothetical protein
MKLIDMSTENLVLMFASYARTVASFGDSIDYPAARTNESGFIFNTSREVLISELDRMNEWLKTAYRMETAEQTVRSVEGS